MHVCMRLCIYRCCSCYYEVKFVKKILQYAGQGLFHNNNKNNYTNNNCNLLSNAIVIVIRYCIIIVNLSQVNYKDHNKQ